MIAAAFVFIHSNNPIVESPSRPYPSRDHRERSALGII